MKKCPWVMQVLKCIVKMCPLKKILLRKRSGSSDFTLWKVWNNKMTSNGNNDAKPKSKLIKNSNSPYKEILLQTYDFDWMVIRSWSAIWVEAKLPKILDIPMEVLRRAVRFVYMLNDLLSQVLPLIMHLLNILKRTSFCKRNFFAKGALFHYTVFRFCIYINTYGYIIFYSLITHPFPGL